MVDPRFAIAVLYLAYPDREDLASRFCAAIGADELRVIEVTPHDYRRMAELLTSYAPLRLQAVDAYVIALAERFDVREVASTIVSSWRWHRVICRRGSGSSYGQTDLTRAVMRMA